MATEIAKKYYPSDINKNIKEIKQIANKETLKDVRKAYLDFKKIHNTEAIQKCQNLNMQIAEARIK